MKKLILILAVFIQISHLMAQGNISFIVEKGIDEKGVFIKTIFTNLSDNTIYIFNSGKFSNTGLVYDLGGFYSKYKAYMTEIDSIGLESDFRLYIPLGSHPDSNMGAIVLGKGEKCEFKDYLYQGVNYGIFSSSLNGKIKYIESKVWINYCNVINNSLVSAKKELTSNRISIF